MPKFDKGDWVLVNGSVVAEIHTYDEDNDRLVYVHEVGGGTNTVYGHISQTRLQRMVRDVEAEDEDATEDGAVTVTASPDEDEITSSESL